MARQVKRIKKEPIEVRRGGLAGLFGGTKIRIIDVEYYETVYDQKTKPVTRTIESTVVPELEECFPEALRVYEERNREEFKNF